MNQTTNILTWIDKKISELESKAKSSIPAIESTICYKQIDILNEVKDEVNSYN